MIIFALSLLKLLEAELVSMSFELLLSSLRFDPETEEYPLHDLDPEKIFSTYKSYLKHGIVNRMKHLTLQYKNNNG